MRATDRSARRRRGFTLVELLVVIAIIGVLVSLTGVTVFRLIGTQQANNTKSELSRLEGELQKEYRAAADKFAKEPIPTSGPLNTAYYGPNGALAMAGNDPNQVRARVIWVKLRLKQTFPNSISEALNPAPMPALPYYQSAFSGYGYATTQPWESSVCLLLALGRAEDGAGVKPEDLGVSSFIHGYPIAPNSTVTVNGLVDGWGQPLAFCRWPVGSTLLNPAGPMNGDNNDPVDPSGLLESVSWSGSPGWNLFTQTYCHPLGQPPAGGKDATSYRIFPLIASSGPDMLLGLNPLTFATTNAGQTADDLYPILAPAQ